MDRASGSVSKVKSSMNNFPAPPWLAATANSMAAIRSSGAPPDGPQANSK
jgi:hypothetical protein